MSKYGSIDLEIKRENRSVKAVFSFVYPEAYPELVSVVDSFLCPREKKYWEKVSHEKRKTSYLTGRYASKLAASMYLAEKNLSKIEIRKAIFEQPIICYETFETPEVTLSHCSQLVAAIAYEAGHYMGVDVERLDLSKTDVYKSQLTEAEISAPENLPLANELVYNALWTMKEALSKTIKVGFMTPFKILETKNLQVQSDGSLTADFTNFAQYKCISWVLKECILSIALPRKSNIGHSFENFA